jgi:hypothetical protein
LVQRFGSALNLNVHFHMLFLDGVYVNADVNSPEFRQVSAPVRTGCSGLSSRSLRASARCWNVAA